MSFIYIGIHILKLRTWELLFLIVFHFSLSINFAPPPPLLKETPKKGCHWRSKMVTILIIDQFEFFNWIWATFWWGINQGEGFIGGMNGKIKIRIELKPQYL